MKEDYYSKWLIERYGGFTVHEAIQSAVDNLLTLSKQTELPIRLSDVAILVGINPTPIYKNQEPWGQLIKINDEFRISLKMKTGKPPSIFWYGYPRLRFSYAHELIHCLHYDFSHKTPIRIAPKSIDKKEEVVCNYGAGLLTLPKILVREYIQKLNSDDVIYVAKNLAKKSHSSLHATFLHLINNDFIKEKENKLYILSAKHEGYRKRGASKPRCIISAIYLNENQSKIFLPTYQGIDVISNSWSLLRFHNNPNFANHFMVKNEIIKFKDKKYILNGEHKKIEDSSYVWSDLHIEPLKLNE
jgi:hypothetical protein